LGATPRAPAICAAFHVWPWKCESIVQKRSISGAEIPKPRLPKSRSRKVCTKLPRQRSLAASPRASSAAIGASSKASSTLASHPFRGMRCHAGNLGGILPKFNQENDEKP
jgi:hypothetical protein